MDDNRLFFRHFANNIFHVIKIINKKLINCLKINRYQTNEEMSQSSSLCPQCAKEFVNKYTLETHMKRVHQKCLESGEDIQLEQFRCRSERCPYLTKYRFELNKHISKCIYVATEKDIQQAVAEAVAQQMTTHKDEVQKLKDDYREHLVQQTADSKDEILKLKDQMLQEVLKLKDQLFQETAKHNEEVHELKGQMFQDTAKHNEEVQELKHRYRQELVDKDMEICVLRSKLELMTSRVQHADQLVDRIADRSTITTTTTNNTYNHIHHVLADGKTYAEMTEYDRIKAIVHENKEKYFWQGQTGAANLVYDHVLCVPNNEIEHADATENDEENEKRMLMVCTDVSRKKCKYNNDKNEVVEDIGAAHFLSKVTDPIIEVAKEWHTSVTNHLNDGKRSKRINELTVDGKTKQVDNALFDIMDIKDEEKNQRFVNKLCTLAKV